MVANTRVNFDIPRSKVAAAFGADIEFDKELAPYSSYATGGKAKYFMAAATTRQVEHAVRSARKLGLPFFLLGGGSNVLISDSGYDGLIVKMDIKGLNVVDEVDIECGAGEDLMSLVDFATEQSLTGLEFAAGIWGSVGGAIYGNAGAFGGEIGSVLSRATLVDCDGRIKEVDRDYCRFGYRHSYLKVSREVVVQARFHLARAGREAIEERVEEILTIRKTKHPVDECTAGCFFKNIPDPAEKYGKLPAGRLLDEAGAKGMSVGGARVFEKHANIIVNDGNATSKDISDLADKLKKTVYDKFGITLQEEVVRVGKF